MKNAVNATGQLAFVTSTSASFSYFVAALNLFSKQEIICNNHRRTIQTVRGSVTSLGLFDLIHLLDFVTAALG